MSYHPSEIGPHLLSNEKLRPGYAETSTRRNPKQPETIVLDDNTIRNAVCKGTALINGSSAWLAFRVPGQRRFYFQYRPW